MELTRLSQVTGDQAYYNAALRIQDSLAKFRGEYGTLVSHFLSPNGGHGGDFTIGGMIDRSEIWSRACFCSPLIFDIVTATMSI